MRLFYTEFCWTRLEINYLEDKFIAAPISKCELKVGYTVLDSAVYTVVAVTETYTLAVPSSRRNAYATLVAKLLFFFWLVN